MNGKMNFDYLNELSVSATKDIPSFVNWNWPVIRKVAFYVFLSGIFAMAAICVGMIYKLPSKGCNPEVPWYEGSVFYEIFPASFKDSNGDGIGDLKGLASQADYLKNLSIGAIRLNSIFQSKHYPDHYQDILNLMSVDDTLGSVDDFIKLVDVLHERNISVILDLPIYPLIPNLSPSNIDNITAMIKNDSPHNPVAEEYRRIERSIMGEGTSVVSAMRFWLLKGVDGFYIKGLENFYDDPYLMENIREWKWILGKDRVLITSKALIDQVSEEVADEILSCIDLVDVFLNVSNGTKQISETVKELMNGRLRPSSGGAMIHWSLNGVNERRVSSGVSPNASLACVLMEMMLPGTPSIFYGDEISLEEALDPKGEHQETKHLHHLPAMHYYNSRTQFTNKQSLPWLPTAAVSYHHLEYVVEAIEVRKTTPAIYKNVVNKEGKDIMNTHVRSNENDLLIIERWFPRRNSYVAITNLGDKKLSLDLSALYYSGELVLGPNKHNKVYFSHFEIKSLETVFVKIDK